MAAKTAVPTSPDTLLRRVKNVDSSAPEALRFVGIDDWAWCKGQRYGTIVVDLETNDVIDLLPNRDAATVKTWLAAHPGIELVSRDRSSAYSLAASEAAPKAQQVADRWHLLKNVREAVERLLEGHVPAITEALKPADPDPGSMANEVPREESGSADRHRADSPGNAVSFTSTEAARAEAGLRRIERFERVHELRRRDANPADRPRTRHASRKAVRGYLRREHCPEWRRTRVSARPWTHTGSGSTHALPKAEPTPLSCIASSHRTGFGSHSPQSVATSPSVWDGLASRALEMNAARPKPTRPPSPEAALVRLGPSP